MLKLILNKIKSECGISVHDYMELCLRHYYGGRDPFGARGDFITAPEISQLFGEMIGIWAASIFKPGMALAELGPGRGTMMSDMLRAAKCFETVYMVETSPALKELQRQNLKKYGQKITWHDSIETLPDQPMIIVANEFFDALPVRQFADGKEVIIRSSNDQLYFDNVRGEIFETAPESLKITKLLSTKIIKNGGAILIIDYGYDKPHGKSTLQAVKNHKYHDFLQNPGKADLTAHVNFPELKKTVEEAGANVSHITTQGEFLRNMGIEIRADILAQKNQQILAGLKRLIDEDQMGELFKVMAIYSSDIKEIPGLNH